MVVIPYGKMLQDIFGDGLMGGLFGVAFYGMDKALEVKEFEIN